MCSGSSALTGCLLLWKLSSACTLPHPFVSFSCYKFVSWRRPGQGNTKLYSCAGLNYATWESAVCGFASAHSLRKLRKQVRASGKDYPPPRLVGPKLMPPAGAAYDPRIGAYVVPFPGGSQLCRSSYPGRLTFNIQSKLAGSDASVVRRTQRALSSLGQAPVQFAASFCVSSRWGLLVLAVFGLIFRTLSGLAIGRFLLLTCPELFSYGVFSKRGPTQKQLETTSFSMLFIGRGYLLGMHLCSPG